jgi:chemotaxis protein MotB
MSNAAKYRLLASLLATTVLTGCVWKSDYNALQAQNQQLQEQLAASQQEVARLQAAVKYVANSDLLFASGGWQMRPQGQQIIADFATKLAPSQQNHLLVSGYTDNAPIGPALRAQGVTSNQELSQKRADAVMQFLISQVVNPSLISARGYGEADPVASNDTPAGRAQNRRVVLSLAGPGG